MPYKAKSELTKAAIKKSYVELLDIKPANQITVRDISERCGFNRNTFYYHYADVPTLVEDIVIDAMDKIIAEHSDFSSLGACIRVMTDFARAHKKAVLNLYNSSNRNLYERYLMKVCGIVVEKYLVTVFGQIPVDPESRAILVRFYKCESFGQIIDWLNNSMSYNIDEEFAKLWKLREGFAETLVERCRTDK